MPNPITYPGQRSFLSVGIEAVQGTPVAPTFTLPVIKFNPRDVPSWIRDVALYGDMAELHGLQQGGVHTEWDLDTYYFGDYGPALFHNLMGDLSEDGVYSGSNTTTLSATAPPGQLFVSTALSIPATTVIAISAGTGHSEVRTITSVSGAGPFTLNFAQPLTWNHPSTETVQPIVAPFQHVESLLNTAQAQSPSLTFIDWQGLTPSTQARAYAGAKCSDITLKGIAESEFITMTAKGLAYPSAAAAALPVANASGALPLPSWRALIGFAGPASGGTQVKIVNEFEMTLTRKVVHETTMQGLQAPYWIQQGPVAVTGRVLIPVPQDETFFNYMINNTQPQLQFVITNGLAGANLLSLQIDIQNMGITGAQVMKGEAIGYELSWSGVAGSVTNAGASGGRSPLKITTKNNVNQAYGF